MNVELRFRTDRPADRQEPHMALEGFSFPESLEAYRNIREPELRTLERVVPELPAPPVPSQVFLDHSKPVVFEGRDDLPVVMFFGGLAGTGWPWLEMAEEINRDFGNTAEVYSLQGHGENIHELPRTTHEHWTEDLILKARAAFERSGDPCIVFGYSTSAIAALEAAAREPDLFRALVVVGSPLRIRSVSQRLGLMALDLADRWIPGASSLLSEIWVPLPPDPPYEDPAGLIARQPSLGHVPLSSLVALYRLQSGAQSALEKVACPILVVQGGMDKYAGLSEARAMFERIASTNKELAEFERSPHPVMLGQERETFKERVKRWFGTISGRGSELSDPGYREQSISSAGH